MVELETEREREREKQRKENDEQGISDRRIYVWVKKHLFVARLQGFVRSSFWHY